MSAAPEPALLAAVADSLGDPLLIVAAGTDDARTLRIVYANPALADWLGRAAGEIAGQPLQILTGPATDPLDYARLVAAIDRRQRVDLMLRLAAGREPAPLAALAGHPLGSDPPAYLVHLRDANKQQALAETVERVGRRLDALSSLTSDAVYHLRVEPDCRLVLDWSAGAFDRISGYDLAAIEGLGGWTALVDPADHRVVQRRSQRLLAGEDATAEYRIRTRSGEPRWLHDAGRPEWDDRHELVTGVLSVARDITEQRRLEDRLLGEQLERKALMSLADGGFCRFDQAGVLREVAAGDVGGALVARLRAGIGRPLDALFGHELAAIWRAEMGRVVPGWSPVGFEFGHPAGAAVERYRVRLTATSGGAIIALIRRRNPPAPPLPVVATTAAEPRLRAIVDVHSAPVVLLAPDLSVVELNAAAERLAGWQRASVVGRPFVELMALGREQPALTQDLRRALAGERVGASEAWLRLPDGQEGRIVWNYTPLADPEGAVLGIFAQGEALAPRAEPSAEPLDDQQRLKAIMDNVADGIVALDLRGQIVSFSRSAEAVFGYQASEVIGRRADMLVVPNGRGTLLDLVIAAAKAPGDSHELMARRKTGELTPIELAVSAVAFNGDTLYIITVRDITLRKQTEETIRNLAYHDPLTGLPNRLLFNDRLTQAIERARRITQPLAVMIVDLDRFKLINDSLGLASGDQVLRAVGERLVASVRKSDTVARLGGDDFLLLLPGTDGAEGAAKVAQKLLDTFAAPLRIDDQELHLGASLGITLYPHDGEDAETLIRNADTALYRAKEHARGSYQFYTTDMNATAFERLVLETQLRKALDRGELVVYYQPQVRLETASVVGVEALVRWFHDDLGLISPAEFVPLAEETGLILELGRWVLATACSQVRSWQEQGFADLRLAVNLSSRQFDQADLVRSIAQVIEETAFDPRDLELELTESSIMRNPDQAVTKLQALDRLGIRLSIDDFGTGYSSLGHLKRFPIRTLKIDQSFIQDITTDPNDAAIAQAIIALAESLKIKVIAEGVETKEQLDLLRRYHCDEMQGYLFARPLPPDQLIELLRASPRLPN